MTNDDSKPQISSEDKQEELERKLGAISRRRIEEQTFLHSKRLGLDYIELSKYPISSNALSILTKDEAKAVETICFLHTAQGISLATVDSKSASFKKLRADLEKRFEQPIFIYLISRETFNEVLKQYDLLPVYKPMPEGVELSAEDVGRFREAIKDFHDLHEKIQNIKTTDVIAFILASAIDSRASDVHLEPTGGDTKVRFRIDGVLYTAAEITNENFQKVLTRLKLAAHLKINVADEPQGGHFVITLPDDTIDVRVSTVPSSFGESVVMRLLRSSATGLALEDLGLRGKAFEVVLKEVARPTGMIMSCGPTGSGKTTFLYAMLNKRNTQETKIITLEDPIEYRIPGLTQSQVEPEKGYTFAKGLKSILRQDPDIIMVGEIRDFDTADTAINAALTGHLVFSTLHTNSAVAAVPRFLALGVKPFLLAPALNVAIGQRLVRRLCQQCRTETELDEETLGRVRGILNDLPPDSGYDDSKPLKFFKSSGCEACQNLGYKGRIGLFEVMTCGDEMKKIILEDTEKVSVSEIEDQAKKEGMVTLVQDGLLKALEGITNVEEVFRVAEE